MKMEPIFGLISWQRLGMTIAVYFTTLAFYRLFCTPCPAFQVPNWQLFRAGTKPIMMSCRMANMSSRLLNCIGDMVGPYPPFSHTVSLLIATVDM